MSPSASTTSPSAIHNEWDDMGDCKELVILMRRDLNRDGSLRCPFPLVRSDSDTAVSKGRRRKPDGHSVDIPLLIQVPECTNLEKKNSCLQLTFDGNVISVEAGEHGGAYPDFAKALRRSRRRKKSQQDALQLTLDGNVITVKEGQAFPDFAAALYKLKRNCKDKKSREHSSFRQVFQSVLHTQ